MSKKFMFGMITAAVIIGAIILIFPDNKGEIRVPESAPVDASTVSSRIDYFSAHGWEVEEISGKNIIIPTDFSTAYEEYAAIQDKQGLPLREYAGRDAKIYVYEVKNYKPQNEKLMAELLVCDDTAIASMIYSGDGGELRFAVG